MQIIPTYKIFGVFSFMKEHIEKQIVEMYNSGLGSPSISKIIDKNFYFILKILKKNGVKLRTAEESARKYIFNENFFKNIDEESKAYFLGFILADGSINKKRNSLKLSLNSQDKDILFKLAEMIQIDQNKVKIRKQIGGFKPCEVAEMVLVSKKMVEDLEKLNIIQNKTFKVRCPNIAENLKRHFWRGILDGDGWISLSRIKEGYLPILECGICGNEFVINNFSKLLDCLDVNHAISKDKSIFRIRLTGERAFKFLNYLYKDSSFSLKRKKDKFDFYTQEKKKQKIRKIGIVPGVSKTVANTFRCNSLISKSGVQKYLGTFKSLKEAIEIQNNFHKSIWFGNIASNVK